MWQREDADKEISVESSLPEFKIFSAILPYTFAQILISTTRNDLQLKSREQSRVQSMILNTIIRKNIGILHYIKNCMDLGTFLQSSSSNSPSLSISRSEKIIQWNSPKCYFCLSFCPDFKQNGLLKNHDL